MLCDSEFVEVQIERYTKRKRNAFSEIIQLNENTSCHKILITECRSMSVPLSNFCVNMF